MNYADTAYICAACKERFPTRQALRIHQEAVHGGKARPERPAEDDDGQKPQDGRMPCPECGKMLQPQGLGAHRAKKHGVPGKSASAVARRKNASGEKPAKVLFGAPSSPKLELALCRCMLDAAEELVGMRNLDDVNLAAWATRMARNAQMQVEAILEKEGIL